MRRQLLQINQAFWAGLIGLGCATASSAQTVAQQPAEFPPASYSETQYVDSRGCVYVRAGIDGNVSWVPRVTRERQPLCGFTPTLAAAQPAVVTAPVVQPLPTAAVAARAPVAQPAPAPVVPVQARSVQVGATEAVARGRGGEGVTAQTRILPRHVLEMRANTRNVRVPKGYRTMWEDDRLNPRRAEQTLAGRAQMSLIWTNTVPRRLVPVGETAEAAAPVIYQRAAPGVQGTQIGEVQIVESSGKTVRRVIASGPITRAPVVSTRSAPRRVFEGR
ncbi:MAG: hypothetical protein AAF943_09905 [Pseudomonadota bacterium]